MFREHVGALHVVVRQERLVHVMLLWLVACILVSLRKFGGVCPVLAGRMMYPDTDSRTFAAPLPF